ncbi:MAG TPA: BlaI/MecI/CopY family transcriptional regulator [Gemmatimonadaceae bacterium]|nr:BlaI/MecI/CopY family transcriptional regulator [Gemmatimonadaceae bacterium]
MPPATSLSRRERQIMDILYRRGSASAAEIKAELPEAPSYSAVRAMLRILEEKGHLKHHADGPRYVFTPVVARNAAQKSALRQMVRTFFDGSATQAVAALLDMSARNLSDDELEELGKLVEQAKGEGK